MSSIGSPSPFLIAGKKSYTVSRSLRFNKDDNAYLTRTPSSAGNRRTWTISIWFKTEGGGSLQSQRFWSTNNSLTDGAYGSLAYENDGFIAELRNQLDLRTTGTFRDPTAWYHLVLALDTTQSTASDRAKLYVNGTQVTDFGTASYPSQNHEGGWNSTAEHNIGRELYQTRRYFGGYMTEFNNIDGLQLTPSSFGETDATTGQWIPKQYSGSYGTNGFYLNFSDNSGTTATTLGKDSSGNGNNFTPNNFAVSDSMLDTPTNNFATMNPLNGYSGLTEGNLRFNTYNDSSGPRSVQATIALPKSGKWYWEARYQESGTGTTTTKYFGVSQLQDKNGYLTAPYVYYGRQEIKNGNNSEDITDAQDWYNGTGVPAIVSIAIDVDNNSVKFYHNNTLQGTITLPTLTSSQEYFFTWANTSGGSSSSLNDTFNFGADSTFQGQVSSGGNTDANGVGDFKYAPPAGHLALCTANLPDTTIKKPNQYFDTLLYTGNGTDNTDRTGLNFQPDWVWIKGRSAAKFNSLYDAVRGAGKVIYSEMTNSEGVDTGLKVFLSDGFRNGTNQHANENGTTYVAWNWDAGETDSKTYTVTVVNDSGNKYRFDGYGTSAVTLSLAKGGTYTFNYPSAHPLRFSTTSDGTHGGGSEYTSGVTTYGNSITITVAANAPTLYYYCSQHSGMGGQVNPTTTLGSSNFDGSVQSTAKVNATAGFSIVTYTRNGSNITVGHGLGVAPKIYLRKRRDSSDNWIAYNTILDGSMDYLVLNAADTKQNSSLTVPTSTKFYDDGSGNMVVYAFSEVAGYSKFGSYTANGNSDGPFVYTGFAPAWVMTKRTNSSASWEIHDNKRPAYNPHSFRLLADGNNTEATSNHVDFVSNGFKVRNTFSGMNQSNGDTYIYLAFASAPFKYANAR